MGAVLECKRESCSGSLAPVRDDAKIGSPITGYVCERCGFTYEAVEVPKGKRRVQPPPAPGEITGRIDDFESSEKQKLTRSLEDADRKLSEIDDLTAGAEAGLGAAIQKVIHPTREEVIETPEEVGASGE